MNQIVMNGKISPEGVRQVGESVAMTLTPWVPESRRPISIGVLVTGKSAATARKAGPGREVLVSGSLEQGDRGLYVRATWVELGPPAPSREHSGSGAEPQDLPF